MSEVVLVRLREFTDIITASAGELALKEGDYVIVELERGVDYGQVVGINAQPEHALGGGLKKIIRVCTPEDMCKIEENRNKAKEALKICAAKIAEYKLEMKLVRAEYSFDRSKVIFYFTANGRVDFRALVKDLAKVFKARLEMKQIGVRDEARLHGGFGPCGRELCCVKFLKDFEPVTIKMAKEEGLPLNPPKISGLCGRLMCCLAYEYPVYKVLSKGLPREGEYIQTSKGKAKVVSVNILKRSVTAQLEDGVPVQLFYQERE